MAWYLNHYRCGGCGARWSNEWSCCCDDECDRCGSRNWSPFESEDLTEVVREMDGEFVVLLSPETAEHYPDYRQIASFTSAALAERFVVDGELT
jgi:hypothetical protein